MDGDSEAQSLLEEEEAFSVKKFTGAATYKSK